MGSLSFDLLCFLVGIYQFVGYFVANGFIAFVRAMLGFEQYFQYSKARLALSIHAIGLW